MRKNNKPQSRQLSRDEKKKMVIERIKEFPELNDRVIARQLGVAHSYVWSVRRDTAFEKLLDTSRNAYLSHPYIKENPSILDGLSERGLRAIRAPGVLDKMQERSLKSPVHAQRLIYRAKIAEEEAAVVSLTAADVDIRVDDVFTGLGWIPSSSVDAVVVDPPYHAVPLYKAIAEVSARVLKPDGGVLVMMCGQAHVDRIIREIAEVEGLRYLWLMSYLTLYGGSTYIEGLGAMPRHKPILLYIKGKRVWKGRPYSDVIEAAPPEDRDKFHQWEQDEFGYSEILRRLVRKNSTVADICCGSGTTGVSAIKLGMKVILSDIDADAVNTARMRVMEALKERNAAE